jgi:acyl-CoA synthetase (AMP-forming)/AMP-acid ligase II
MTLDRPTNIAHRLVATARVMPDALAVVVPRRRDRSGRYTYDQYTFRELDQDSDRLARGLRRLGVQPGTRLVLLVRPGFDFISLVFGLFKAGAVGILIDPGMGRRNLIACLEESRPQGFIAIPLAHAARLLFRRRFPESRLHVTVGRRWFWGGVTLDQLRGEAWSGSELAVTTADDPAAIIFTTGSTGPPKGVVYQHGNFDAQVDELRDFYGIRPGEVDLPGFPLFALFNCALGVTTVVPDMDPTRPARVDPQKIVAAVRDWNVTQAFGSPAIWRRVGPHCLAHGVMLPSLRRVLSAGAAVPADVLESMRACIHPQGEVHTPYGATEALPVASISATEVLGETAALTREGAGVCVGKRFPQIEWKIIQIVDGPIASIEQAVELPAGEIGELIVCGPVVTREYLNRPQSNALGKIMDGALVWHRMGDVGYFDPQERFWYCGRMNHRVVTAGGTLFTEQCEAIFNRHANVFRSALVGTGPRGSQRPLIIVEPRAGRAPHGRRARERFLSEIRQLGRSSPLTAGIDDFLIHPGFPVDIRHNAKIFREKLAIWAERKVR